MDEQKQIILIATPTLFLAYRAHKHQEGASKKTLNNPSVI
ncbi:gap junction protein [Marinobacter daepoensis]|nr:gap junction protein [Marinobacter daepoensis]